MTTLGDPRIQVAEGNLVISEVVDSDSQEFVCSASNTVGTNSSTAYLNVLGIWMCVCVCVCV